MLLTWTQLLNISRYLSLRVFSNKKKSFWTDRQCGNNLKHQIQKQKCKRRKKNVIKD